MEINDKAAAASPARTSAGEVPPTPEWPLLPFDAACAVADAVKRATWDPTVLSGVHPLEEGPLTAFERAMSDWLEIPYAAALSSGAAALHTALMAAGVGKGD